MQSAMPVFTDVDIDADPLGGGACGGTEALEVWTDVSIAQGIECDTALVENNSSKPAATNALHTSEPAYTVTAPVVNDVPSSSTCTCTATRYDLHASRCCGEGQLFVAADTKLAHVIRGAPLWCMRPPIDCRLEWMHKGHELVRSHQLNASAWAPADRSWLVYSATPDEPPAWLLVFRTAYEASRLAEALDCVEPAWGAEVAVAIEGGAQVAARGLRGAAEAIVSGVRWSKAAFVESVEGHDEASAVDPNVRAAVARAREVANTVATVGDQVAYTVAGAAFVAGQTVAETAESAGMLEWQETPQGRAYTKVTSSGLRAARDVFGELGTSLSDIWNESAKAVTDAVQHTSGDEVAEVTAQALEASGNVGGAAMGLAPTVLARKAVFAGVLGANKIDVPGAEDATTAATEGIAELQKGMAGLLQLEDDDDPKSADAAARHLELLSGACEVPHAVTTASRGLPPPDDFYREDLHPSSGDRTNSPNGLDGSEAVRPDGPETSPAAQRIIWLEVD